MEGNLTDNFASGKWINNNHSSAPDRHCTKQIISKQPASLHIKWFKFKNFSGFGTSNNNLINIIRSTNQTKKKGKHYSDKMPTRTESFRWFLPRTPQRRLIYKNGDCNVMRENINKRGQRYLADIFTTLIDIKWRWNLFIFDLAFSISWFVFAFIWWLIGFSHGDLTNHDRPGWNSCVENVHDFSTALLFSIETQQTIGYGSRVINSHCIEAIAVFMLQCTIGIMIQALMTGLVFAKLSRPKKRAQTLMFSKSAVICERDGTLCFLFRVGDMRRSAIVEAQIRAIFVSKRMTKEGEMIPHYQKDMTLGTSEGRLFLVWPVILEHKIDQSSPLWDLTADDLQKKSFEIVVVLEGNVESTGMTTQARTSYLPSEILWGHRFERLIRFHNDSGTYIADYSKFDNVTTIEMSQDSAQERSKHPQPGTYTTDDDDTDAGEFSTKRQKRQTRSLGQVTANISNQLNQQQQLHSDEYNQSSYNQLNKKSYAKINPRLASRNKMQKLKNKLTKTDNGRKQGNVSLPSLQSPVHHKV